MGFESERETRIQWGMSLNRERGPINMRAGHRYCRRPPPAPTFSGEIAGRMERVPGRAPGAYLAEKFGINCELVDIDNPA